MKEENIKKEEQFVDYGRWPMFAVVFLLSLLIVVVLPDVNNDMVYVDIFCFVSAFLFLLVAIIFSRLRDRVDHFFVLASVIFLVVAVTHLVFLANTMHDDLLREQGLSNKIDSSYCLDGRLDRCFVPDVCDVGKELYPNNLQCECVANCKGIDNRFLPCPSATGWKCGMGLN